jgi:hypothetical protein
MNLKFQLNFLLIGDQRYDELEVPVEFLLIGDHRYDELEVPVEPFTDK